jgi:hypothetical protein
MDLHATELPSNDWEIFDVVVERVFADLAILEDEVPGVVVSIGTASARTSSSVALVPDAVVSKQSAPGQDGDVGGPAPSVASEAVEGILGGSAVGVESIVDVPILLATGMTVDAPPPSTTGAVESVAEVAEPSSVQPAVVAEEEASQPVVVPQEHNNPEGVSRAASPEI